MKQKSFVLNKKVSKFIDRKDVCTLKEYLPEKYEYTLNLPLSSVQESIYRYYKDTQVKIIDGKSLMVDYQNLRKCWTHIRVMRQALEMAKEQKIKKLSSKKDHQEASQENDSQNTLQGNVEDHIAEIQNTKEWWKDHIHSEDDYESIEVNRKHIFNNRTTV